MAAQRLVSLALMVSTWYCHAPVMTSDRVSVTSQRDIMTSHDTKKADIMNNMPPGPGVCLLQCGDVSSQKITGRPVSGRGKRGTHPSSERLLWKPHLQVITECAGYFKICRNNLGCWCS